MTDQNKKRPRIKFEDKRRRNTGASSASSTGERDEIVDAQIVDQGFPAEGVAPEGDGALVHGYLDDLRRLQAEFDNFRKRVVREQTALTQRASARLIERLLPILDNFDAAVDHGEGGPGVSMVHAELKRVLAEEGVEEIEAEGSPFDPRVHEAFEAHHDETVDGPVVAKVLRRGYWLKGQVLRPAMVSVARPVEPDSQNAAEG